MYKYMHIYYMRVYSHLCSLTRKLRGTRRGDGWKSWKKRTMKAGTLAVVGSNGGSDS